MRVGIATVQVPFVRGGAEMLAESLLTALRDAGHEAEIIAMPFKWYPAARVPEHMLAARLMQVEESVGQRIDRLIGLKFPAYLMPHPSKRLWLLHQHRSAYDLWDAPFSDLLHAPDGAHVREAFRSPIMACSASARRSTPSAASSATGCAGSTAWSPSRCYHPPPGAERLRPGRMATTSCSPAG